MDGLQLDYKLKKGMSSRFNQKMFGRISSRNRKGNIYACYIPGVLDSVPYYRIFEGRVFLGTVQDIDFDPVMKFCDIFDISSSTKDDDDIFLKTGKERWQFHAKERGCKIGWK